MLLLPVLRRLLLCDQLTFATYRWLLSFVFFMSSFMSTSDLILDTSSSEGLDIVSDATVLDERDNLMWFIDRHGRHWMGDFNSNVLVRKSID